jgi:hypothetical protein
MKSLIKMRHKLCQGSVFPQNILDVVLFAVPEEGESMLVVIQTLSLSPMIAISFFRADKQRNGSPKDLLNLHSFNALNKRIIEIEDVE